MAFINYAALAAIVLSNLPTSAMSALTFTSMTKEALVEKFVSQDGDVEFSNIKASIHYDKCTRYYTGGHSMGYAWLNDDNATLTDVHLIPDEGIMLSSGDPLDFESNDSDQETTRWYTSENKLFDEHLAATINNNAVFDACFVEFDFKCSGEGYVPQVSFKYMFGSEEYYEYVDSPYNDAFALLLNGVNIARLPSTESNSDVVSINNVNYHLNRQFFHGNDPGTGDLADPMHDDLGMVYPQMEPDGFTIILTAHGTPWQNSDQTNSIKIVVGDVGDGILDSWVLLESGTFSCVDITESPSMSSQPSSGESTDVYLFHIRQIKLTNYYSVLLSFLANSTHPQTFHKHTSVPCSILLPYPFNGTDCCSKFGTNNQSGTDASAKCFSFNLQET